MQRESWRAREERSVAHTRLGCSGSLLSADQRVSSRQLIPQMTLPCECTAAAVPVTHTALPAASPAYFLLFALTFQMSFRHGVFALSRLHAELVQSDEGAGSPVRRVEHSSVRLVLKAAAALNPTCRSLLFLHLWQTPQFHPQCSDHLHPHLTFSHFSFVVSLF